MAESSPSGGLCGRSHEIGVLDRLLEAVQGGLGSPLVVRGEPGIGKTALMRHLGDTAVGFRTLWAHGVESEMELPLAGLHQLCSSLVYLLPRLPEPQRDALATAFGLRTGTPPDRWLVGLATLTLLTDAAEQGPLLCVVDDAQWLDQASTQALAFVARRLMADRVGLVIATRDIDDGWSGLPELAVGGIGVADARTVLRSLPGTPVDEQLRDRIVAEAHGNPLALLEWHRTLTPAERAGMPALPSSGPLAGRVEESFRRRITELPAETQRFLLVAAAEPVGDAALVTQAAERLGLSADASVPAIEAELVDVMAEVRFRHPLVRSAAYQLSPSAERQRAHQALAEVTDPDADPDRRAWHRALAARGPDEQVAEELEGSASRAQARGGLAAAAVCLERAVRLTADRSRRVDRALNAAQTKYRAGALDDASELLAIAELGPVDDLQRVRRVLLRARIDFAARHSTDACRLLLEAARDAETREPDLARGVYLEALHIALHVGRFDPTGVRDVGRFVLASQAASPAIRPRDLLLHGLAARVTKGYAAGAPVLKKALAAFRPGTALAAEDEEWEFLVQRVASDLWDSEGHAAISAASLRRARQTGAIGAIPNFLDTRSISLAASGELREAAATLDEKRAVCEATGIIAHGEADGLLASLRGHDPEASELTKNMAREATAHRDALGLASAEHAIAILSNGLGRYDAALDAVREAGERFYEIGTSTRAVAEAVEAAVRSGNNEVGERALNRLAEIAGASGTGWSRGVEARCRALLSEGAAAEELFRDSIEHLGRTQMRPDLARAYLLFGEWLRRANRRADARQYLRRAHDELSSMGMEAFADRARRELLATGETVRKRTVESLTELTPQEACIARLAAEGLSNPEIGSQLFVSSRTVEWHLRKVFTKLGISSRQELGRRLPVQAAVVTGAT
jgi:DNA-binding CsgD family transcriptional regulator